MTVALLSVLSEHSYIYHSVWWII